MEFNGDVVIVGNAQEIWEIISDPGILVNCVPGAQEVNQLSETKYEGVIKRELAGVSLTLDGTVEITEMDEPNGLTANASGVDNRSNSRMEATAEMAIVEGSSDTSTLEYFVDIQFTGRLATLGARIVKRKINSDIRTFFDNVKEYAES